MENGYDVFEFEMIVVCLVKDGNELVVFFD